MKIRSLEEKLAACEKDNENLERIINLPAEELASQALERSFAVKRALGMKDANSSRRAGNDYSSLEGASSRAGNPVSFNKDDSAPPQSSDPAHSDGRSATLEERKSGTGLREDQSQGADGKSSARLSPTGLVKGTSSISPLAQQVITALSTNTYVPSSRQNANGKTFRPSSSNPVDMDENYLI